MFRLTDLRFVALALAVVIAVPAAFSLLLAAAIALPSASFVPGTGWLARPAPSLVGSTGMGGLPIAPTAASKATPSPAAAAQASDESALAVAPVSHSVRIVDGGVLPLSQWGFDPPRLIVRVGDTVTWTNDGAFSHTVTAANGAFDSGQIAPGAQWSFTATTPGTFEYSCVLHPSMKGALVVEPLPAMPASTPMAEPVAPGENASVVPAEHAFTPTMAPPAQVSEQPSTLAAAVTQTPLQSSLPSQPNGQQLAARIVDGGFDPPTITVVVGDTVTWTNVDDRPHTVTATDGSFRSEAIAPGASWSFTVTSPGTFAYFCEFHPEMRGTLVVREAGVVTSGQAGGPSPGASASPIPAAPIAVGRVEADLIRGAAFPTASGRARFESSQQRRKLRVEIEDVPSLGGERLSVVIGGVDLGGITVSADGRGELELDTNEGATSLPASVAGQAVEVRTEGHTVVLAGQFR